ncbi:endonuclease [Photobacterium sanctipauli]|uniref:Endonuclease n=1 Tax=Photobacterium sanctipauli TaxID=1342794 RepID=A0A2T3NPE1_9GAMM|nr:ExeM/NucH family extracellular endonuclease [Photobacterium sanctipauli]PSW18077.1 endonuclease [Photobacterium sanctipauli]
MSFVRGLSSGLALLTLSAPAASQLLITEYVEGSSNNKAIELTNLSESNINLADYSIQLAFNESTEFTKTISLNAAELAPGESYVLHHDDAASEIQDIGNQFSGSLTFNGNDTVALFQDDSLIDSLGQLGDTQDYAIDVTLRRNPDITDGRTDVESEFNVDEQWTSYSKDTFDGLGCSGLETCGNTSPPPKPFMCDFNNLTPIYQIQGDGDRSPMVPEDGIESDDTYFVSGIVTMRGESLFKGFYLQDPIGDGDNATSDGIYVYLEGEAAPDTIQPGTEICLEATVKEYYGNTQLDVSDSAYRILSTGNEALAPVPLRVEEGETLHDALERHEGMQVALDADSPLVITRNFSYDYDASRNNLVLANESPLYNPTHMHGAETQAAQDLAAANAVSRVYVESDYKAKDGELPWFDNFNPVDGYLRMGDQLTGLTAMVGYSYDEYRLVVTNTIGSGDIIRDPENERVDEPTTKTEQGLKVAGFNVLNYFNSFAEAGNPNPMCTEAEVGPNDDCYRGAGSLEEFELQQEKLVNAIIAMDADVVALMEIENNGFDSNSAVQSLVNAINDKQADKKAHYQNVDVEKSDLFFKEEPGFEDIGYFGTDAITVGLIYRADAVKAKGKAQQIQMPEQHAPVEGDGVKSAFQRHAMLQTFTVPGEKEPLSVVVNHFKSKGSTCWEDDQLPEGEEDIQGSCNNFRVSAAKVLGESLNDIDGDVLVMGDLNSYGMEDPILTLTSIDGSGREGLIYTASHTTLNGEVYEQQGQAITQSYGLINLKGKEDYSYSYEGELGSLDYALANPALADKVTAVEAWHINAAESNLFEYSEDYTGDLEKSDNIYSSSDHDPIIVTVDYHSLDGKTEGEDDSGGSIPLSAIIALAAIALLRRHHR